MHIGLQLYTVRSFTQNKKDFEITLKKIAKIGYTTIQLSAIGQGIEPEWIREKCDQYGLDIVLTHSDCNRILYDTEALIKEHDILGCKYIGLGCMPERYRYEGWIKQFADDFLEPAKKIAQAGKLFMYHNHNFEFEKIGEKRILEYLLESFTKDQLGITLDTYWVQVAGADITDWIEILKDRIPCVHLKDVEVKNGNQRMAPVMEGNINFVKVLKALKKTCCEHLLVEQDTCYEDPFVSAKKSYDNLAKLEIL